MVHSKYIMKFKDKCYNLQQNSAKSPYWLIFIDFFFKIYLTYFKPVIITEFASNGSLEQIIDMERNGFSISGWDDTAKLININGIAAGILYLHQNNILHRDLKPANILVLVWPIYFFYTLINIYAFLWKI